MAGFPVLPENEVRTLEMKGLICDPYDVESDEDEVLLYY